MARECGVNRAEQLVSECCRLVAPPPRQSLSEWAEEHFRLSPEYSAGTGKLTLYQFQRGILNSFTDPYVKETVVMSATQMIKTLFIQCCVAYAIARDPGPILLAQPTETGAETFSKERIAPMIRDMECLRARVAPEKRTSKANTTLHKVFDGGSLTLIGAQTADNFARRSIRYFFADERDKWPKNVGKEGDGYSLGVKRQATFRSRAKRVQTCSPTVEGDSQIAAAYEESDQRKFWVPCPHCGEYQVLRWPQVVWDATDPAGTARYKCEHCAALWDDGERWDACERGEWRAERPFHGIAGFWISELYSPWKKMGELVADFLRTKDDPALFQTFVNTSLAETWKEKGEAPAFEILMSRREDYKLGQVPPGVLFLTAGVDVQKTWLQGHVWGWGRGRQRWIIDRWLLEGDPYHETTWAALTERLNQTYRHPNGAVLATVRMAVDSGFATQEVYRWARQQGPGRVMVVKGVDSGAALVTTPQQVEVSAAGRRIKHGARVYLVNVSMCKSELYGLLAKDRPADGEPFPVGWIHFASDLDEEFFRQLTAEQIVSRVVKGYRKHEWVKVRERNEDLDCANYARAAASVFGVDRFSEHRWREFESVVGTVVRPEPVQEARVEQPTITTPAPVPTPQSRPSGGGWFGDRRGGGWFSR